MESASHNWFLNNNYYSHGNSIIEYGGKEDPRMVTYYSHVRYISRTQEL